MNTYDHRTLRTRLPVRSALFKQRTGGSVLRDDPPVRETLHGGPFHRLTPACSDPSVTMLVAISLKFACGRLLGTVLEDVKKHD